MTSKDQEWFLASKCQEKHETHKSKYARKCPYCRRITCLRFVKGRCATCNGRVMGKLNYRMNPQIYKDRRKAYYQKNREKILEKIDEYKKTKKGMLQSAARMRKYRRKNRLYYLRARYFTLITHLKKRHTEEPKIFHCIKCDRLFSSFEDRLNMRCPKCGSLNKTLLKFEKKYTPKRRYEHTPRPSDDNQQAQAPSERGQA